MSQGTEDLLALGSCVENEVQRGSLWRLLLTIHQKALAIGSHIVGEEIGGRDIRAPVRREQKDWGAGSQRCFHGDGRGEHGSLWIHIEDLFAIGAPARFLAASARDLQLSARSRERRNVNLPERKIVV